MTQTFDDSALVRRLKDGDTTAFDEIYAAYRPRLFTFLVRLCRRRDLAEDLLQETWIRLARTASRLRDDTRLAAWLYTVARNLYLSHRRWSIATLEARGWLSRESFAAAERTTPFDLTSASELERKLEAALAALPLTYREPLLLVAVERLEPAVVAEMLGLRPDALRQRVTRARAMVAELIEDPEPVALAARPILEGGSDAT